MAKAIESALRTIEDQGVPYQTLTAGDVFPCWGDSDPRLGPFPTDFRSLTLLDVIKGLRNPEILPTVWKRLRLFCSVLIDGLKVWNDYERYREAVAQDVDLADPVELAKFDEEFRRYLSRTAPEQVYEEDFEDDFRPGESSFFNSTFDHGDTSAFAEFQASFGSTLSRGSEISFEFAPVKESGCEETLYEQDSIEDPNETDSSPDCSQQIVDDYEIVKFLGKGGEGKVYLAYSPSKHKHVALKQYEVEVTEGTQLYELLSKEVEVMRKFEHQNVVKCMGLFNPPASCEGVAVCNLILEYVSGGSLADYLKHNGPMEDSEIKKVARDVLQGLDYIHRRGLIHRDIKPSNVLIGDYYKITDFGLSAVVLELESIARSCVGTPWYMAPEVIQQEPYSYSADIWSLACLLLELKTGERPFQSASATRALRLMVDCESPLDFKKYDLDPELKDFLEKCWRKQHSLRPSALELLGHPFVSDLV